MPHCTFCQSEFVEGIETCSDCGRKLKPGSLPEPVAESFPDVGWIRLYECDNDLEAELITQLLENAGIPVLRKGTLRGSYGVMGSTMRLPGDRVILLVPEDRIGKAQRIVLSRLNAGRFGESMKRQRGEKAQIIRVKRRIRKR
ncbi:MAG: DUF2007 domain-containing protein [bacterium]|nr:DUF2007 domain-containing protein [bacterium]